MKTESSNDTYQFYFLVACLQLFWFFAFHVLVASEGPATPWYYYGIIMIIYVVYVLINEVGKHLVKSPDSLFATILANTVPFSVIILPFLTVYQADKINGTTFILNGLWSSVIGYPSLLIGATLLFLCEYKFKREASGTLSPVEEFNTQSLVTAGLYSYVRNPMIIGILFLILGLSFSFESNRFLCFLPYFFLAKTIWFKYSEEPSMERRFGSSYVEYKQNVPRWVPRFSSKSQPKNSVTN